MVYLHEICIKIQMVLDKLRWGYSPKGIFSTNEAYDIWTNNGEMQEEAMWKKVWKENAWPKVATFLWLVMHHRIITWENLKK